MKIFGHPMSTCTRKVLTTCVETNTPYELETVDFGVGAHKQEPHLSRQPFGQLPAIDDDGFALYESRAICRYIDDKAGRVLQPADIRTRALMEQWISVETSNFTPHAMKFVYRYVFKREVADDAMATASTGLAACLTVMEAQLAKTPYLSGDAFTLADLGYMPYIEYSAQTPAVEIYARFPQVMAWWNKVSDRPSWKQVTGRK